MANFASLRGPVGMNRVYVNSPNRAHWTEALRQGKSFATNGPLLGFTLNGQDIGSVIKLPAGKQELTYSLWLRSIVPIDHLQIIYNGRIAQEIELNGDHTSMDASGKVKAESSGWFVLRAWSEKAIFPVLDIYPYATTSPIYVTVGNQPVRSSQDAGYFLKWIDRVLEEARTHAGYNTEAEKQDTLKTLLDGRAVFEQRKQGQ